MSRRASQQSRARRSELRSAQQQVQRERERRRVRLERGLTILVVIAAVIAVAWVVIGRRPHEPSAHPRARASGNTLVVGNDLHAAVTVTVYEDFLCPYCHEFEESTRDMLRQAALDGRAVIVYRPFQLLQDGYSRRALDAWFTVLDRGTGAQALRYHDELYDHQPYENSPGKPGVSKLRGWAEDAGVHRASVLDAIGAKQESQYVAAQKAAAAADVLSTPWVLVNGQRVPGSTIGEIKKGLEEDLRAN